MNPFGANIFDQVFGSTFPEWIQTVATRRGVKPDEVYREYLLLVEQERTGRAARRIILAKHRCLDLDSLPM